MAIIGGLDIHRRQLTFDCVCTQTGQVVRGKLAPADREHLRQWLTQFAGVAEVSFAIEACAGWRYVAEEMTQAGATVVLVHPLDTWALRGKRRRAKTDRADARLLRQALAEGRLQGCYIPPTHVLECRALLGTYLDLRREHTAWIQRLHAVLFHHGTPLPPAGKLSTEPGRRRVLESMAVHLSSTGQLQVDVAAAKLDTIEQHLYDLRRELLRRSRQLRGARLLQQSIYGVGPITALALVCWLGGADRFSSSRKAVRFAGLDITVRSSDAKRSPGRLSRQGPPVLRWCLYEAGKVASRTASPDHDYYAAVKERKNGKRAALSQARRIARLACHLLGGLGDDAFTVVAHTKPARVTARRFKTDHPLPAAA